MQARTKLPWEGDTDNYAGTLSSLGNSKKTGREMRGKAKANKQAPRTRSMASVVTDGQGNEVHVASRRRQHSTPRAIIGVRAPEVVRMGRTNNIGLDYS